MNIRIHYRLPLVPIDGKKPHIEIQEEQSDGCKQETLEEIIEWAYQRRVMCLPATEEVWYGSLILTKGCAMIVPHVEANIRFLCPVTLLREEKVYGESEYSTKEWLKGSRIVTLDEIKYIVSDNDVDSLNYSIPTPEMILKKAKIDPTIGKIVAKLDRRKLTTTNTWHLHRSITNLMGITKEVLCPEHDEYRQAVSLKHFVKVLNDPAIHSI